VSSPAIGRVDRRKARTRAALISAGQRILADRGTTEVAVQDITDEAGVGLGSFYNHFTTKAELFEAAVFDLLDAFAAGIDAARADVQDPAELVAIGIRLTCRLASTRPAVARVLVLSGADFLVADRGLARLALRDIGQGISTGRFTVARPALALALVGGSVLAFLQIRLTGDGLTDDGPTDNGLTDTDADDLATTVLTTLGVPPDEAADIAHRKLPELAAGPGTAHQGELS
jgi:AcrR family transcriptional regulator